MKITFDFAALHYLDQWIEEDSKWHKELNDSDQSIRLKALNTLARNYQVIRNLPRRYDIDATPCKKRLSPILDIIEKPDFQNITIANRVEIIEKIVEEIKQHYHKRVLSFVTKALWVKHKDPIIIYDSKARETLKKYDYPSGENNISKYITSWERFYQHCQTEINEACKSLYKARRYSKFANELTDQQIKDISSQLWFQHRVFDIFLFFEGEP